MRTVSRREEHVHHRSGARNSLVRLDGPRPTQPPVRWQPGLFPGDIAAGVWRWPLTPFQRRICDWAELYLYSPLCAFMACYGVTYTSLLCWEIDMFPFCTNVLKCDATFAFSNSSLLAWYAYSHCLVGKIMLKRFLFRSGFIDGRIVQ